MSAESYLILIDLFLRIDRSKPYDFKLLKIDLVFFFFLQNVFVFSFC